MPCIAGPARFQAWRGRGVGVVGVNTARGAQPRLNWSKGQISSRQADEVAGWFQAGDLLRIVVVHHPLIELMAVGFILVPWPPVVEFAIMCVVTLILSYAAHQLLRKSAIALFLFNGIRRKSAG